VTSVSGGADLTAGRDLTVGGDVVGRNKIITNIQNIYKRALSVAEEAKLARDFEQQHLAHGVSQFAERLKALAIGSSDTGGPYKGLLEYHLSDTAIFFGRDKDIREVLQRLQRDPLTTLHSESGAGKTSLLQAGVSPRLIEDGHLPVYVRPHNIAPTLAVKKVLLPDLTFSPELTGTSLRGFLHHVCDVLGATTTLYIFLDQFEEFFTRLDEPERMVFVNELAECTEDSHLKVKWLLSLRGEYFSNLSAFQSRIRHPFENEYHLNRLTREQAVDVIAQPAELRGVRFEDGLIDTILDELGKIEVSPPQVQLICSALYGDLPQGTTTITRDAYDQEGGAAGILRGYLERVLNRDLPPSQRPTARWILEALVTSDSQRAVRTHAELLAELQPHGAEPTALDAILSQLVNSRLLRSHEGSTDNEQAYELVHDYLLAEIQLDPEVQARKAAQELLDQEVRAYHRYKTLLTVDRLQVIESYIKELRLTSEAQELVSESRAKTQRESVAEEARRQKELNDARKLAEAQTQRAEESARSAAKLRQRAVYLAAALVVALMAIGIALFFNAQSNQNADTAVRNAAEAGRNAATAQAASTKSIGEANNRATAEANALTQRDEAQRQAHIARSRELAAQALSNLDKQIDLSLLLSVEADGTADTAEARIGLLSGLQHSIRIENILRGHSNYVRSVAFSPDGKTLVTSGGDHTIVLWDVSNPLAPMMLGKPLTGHTDTVMSIAFSPNGKILASGSADKTIRLWDVSNLEEPKALGTPLIGHTAIVYSVAFGPDGNMLASSSGDTTIRLWDVSNPQAPKALGFRAGIDDTYSLILAFSPDGKTLASGTEFYLISLWNVSNPQVLQAMGEWVTASAVASLTFSPDGNTLAAGCSDKMILLLDVSNRQAPRPLSTSLTGHTDVVWSVAFSPDGKKLASGSADKTIRIWDVSDLQSPKPLGAPLTGHTDVVFSVAFSWDGKTLASGSGDQTTILWNMSNSAASKMLGTPLAGHVAPVTGVAFSPDGKTLASSSEDQTIRLWDVTNPRVPMALGKPLVGHIGIVTSVAFSPDSKTLASGGLDHTVRLWDVSSPHRSTTLGLRLHTIQTGEVLSVVFSPDGKTLASGGLDHTVRLWDVSDLQAPKAVGKPLNSPAIVVDSVVFSPDGMTLAAGSKETIRLWDMSNLQAPMALGKPFTDHASAVLSVAFSPDGKTLASGSWDQTIRLWDVSNPQTPKALGIRPLIGHTDAVYSVAFSPDGKMLVSGSWDDTVRLWDVSNPQMPKALGVLVGHAYNVSSVAFSPDGKTLASGSWDKTIILWDVDPESWQAHACQIAGRNLTRAEWQQYIGDEPYRKTCEQWPLEPEATPTP